MDECFTHFQAPKLFMVWVDVLYKNGPLHSKDRIGRKMYMERKYIVLHDILKWP